MIYLTLFLFGLYTYYNYEREYRFANRRTIERITGVTLPNFKVIEYTKGRMSFQGDYNDQLIIEFKETPSAPFYQTIDSLIATNHTGWTGGWAVHDDTYSYDYMWGNGLPAPNGEDSDEDMTFSISFKKGSKQAIINFGAW